jgi:hypothetical protein
VRSSRALLTVIHTRTLRTADERMMPIGRATASADQSDLAQCSVSERHIGGRVLAARHRDYGAVGPLYFAGYGLVVDGRRGAVIERWARSSR